MKNKKIFIFIIALAVCMSGVLIYRYRPQTSTPNTTTNTSENNISETITFKDKKVLVTYFSVPETTKTTGLTQDEENSTVQVNGKSLGNTQYVASLIQEATGADIYRIEPVNAYPTNHDELLDRAIEERRNNTRPEIKDPITNLDDYDIIFVGYPIWNADLPPILYSFLESNDFSGKTVIPFCTHGGSGLSDTVNTITQLLPDTTVISDGFALSRNEMENAPSEVTDWLKGLVIK